MRLILDTLTLSLAAVVAAAPAAASTFERDGARYQYNRVDKPDGVVLIDGRALDDGTSFSLRVKAGHVTGTMAGQSVDFHVSNDKIDAPAHDRSAAIAAK